MTQLISDVGNAFEGDLYIVGKKEKESKGNKQQKKGGK